MMIKKTSTIATLVISILLVTTISAMAGQNLYVGEDAPADFITIKAAINAAADGDTIIVRDGTYTGTGNCPIDPKGKAIVIKSENGPQNCIIDCQNNKRAMFFDSGESKYTVVEGFTINSGFCDGRGGGIYCRNSSPTIVDCIINGCEAEYGGGGAYFTGSRARLTKCVFTDNIASSHSYCDDEGCRTVESLGGGAIYLNSSDLTFEECDITANSAHLNAGGILLGPESTINMAGCTISENSAPSAGGGIYVEFGSNFTITDCLISMNTAGDGGGIYNAGLGSMTDSTISENTAQLDGGGMFNMSSSPTIKGCDFIANEALQDDGGGMFNVTDANPRIIDCTFELNWANEDGGGMATFQSKPQIINSIFNENSAEEDGGGMYNFLNSAPTVTACQFTGNSANDDGGALCNRDTSRPTMDRCTFNENRSRDNGGAIFNRVSSGGTMTDCTFTANIARTAGGAMYSREDSNPVMINCSMIDNNANDSGGALFFRDDCRPILQNCTIADNSATFDGGGIANTDDCYPQITDCILWGNSGDGGTDGTGQIYGGSPNIQFSCIQQWTGVLEEYGNIVGNPQFVSGEMGDYYLSHSASGQSQTSPCVNAGSTDTADIPVTLRTTRTDHVFDTNIMDMGRHYIVQLPGDVNANGKTNLADFTIIAAYWQKGTCGQCGGADLAGNDQTVNFDDLIVFADGWLQ